MESELKIRRLEGRDVDEVLALEKACPELAHWERKDYQDVAIGGMEGWVATRDDKLAGFVVMRQIRPEVEILNLAVAAQERRRGAGTRLLREALDQAGKNGAARTFLEVRVSNDAALRLYQSQGFSIVGRRPAYYRAPIEDALTLAMDMGGDGRGCDPQGDGRIGGLK